MNKRREFLKTTCALCGVTLASGSAGVWLSGCKTLEKSAEESGFAVRDGFLKIPVSAVAAEGSVIQAHGLSRELYIHQNADGTFEALLLRCTHMNGKLNPTPEGFTCALHGSRFAKTGAVLKGPAKEPLKKYPVNRQGDQLIIQIA